jgi:hypothetical protein
VPGHRAYPCLVERSDVTTYRLWLVKWDTTGQNFKDITCFLQSASLYSHYYHLQILVHRPFIPSPRKPSPLSFPSLAICTNAARSCAHVVDLQRRRAPQYPSSHFQARVFLIFHGIPESVADLPSLCSHSFPRLRPVLFSC